MMQEDFVFIDQVARGIRWDAKYATWDNFTGKPVDGYEVNRVAGTYALAHALLDVQKEAATLGCGLLIWDGYRPKRAVDCFLRWSAMPEDNRTKPKYYPKVARNEMIAKGYVASRSSHSRGSAVDLTLYRLDTGMLLPMGSHFDFMDERSHHAAQDIARHEAENRLLLRTLMENNGFEPYAFEWWHYVLCHEPYPDSYFDFSVA